MNEDIEATADAQTVAAIAQPHSSQHHQATNMGILKTRLTSGNFDKKVFTSRYQQLSAEQLFRFLDAQHSYADAEINACLRGLTQQITEIKASKQEILDSRREFWLDLRSVRRR